MNEDLLRERLRDAASDALDPRDVEGDIARGRLALKRRRRVMLAGSAASVAVVAVLGIGAGQLIDPGSSSQGNRGAGAAGTTTGPGRVSESTPAVNPHRFHLWPTSNPRTVREREFTRRLTHSQMFYTPYPEWRQSLYDLTARHLDPDHQFINYSTDSMQGGGGANGAWSLGIKMGWATGNDTGEGMVEVEVASAGSHGILYCDVFGPCTDTQVPGHGTVQLSGDPSSGGYAVIVTQDDGERVLVIIDPLFGNNSLTPTTAQMPSLDEVLDLAEDPSLNLP